MKRRRILVLLVVLIAVAGTATAWYRQAARVGEAEAPWVRVEPLPTARSEMPAAAANGVIYVPGGLGAFGRTLTTFEAYDSAADSWSTLTPLPLPLHHTGATGMDGRIYVAGGYTDLDFRTDNDRAWVFDPASGEWSSIANMPAGRAAHVLAASGGSIYAIGGVGPRSEEVWAYDPESDSWQTGLAPIPTPREHLSAAVVDGRIYAIGGRVSGRNVATAEVYDPAEDSWSTLPDMPTARSGLTAAAVDGRIHVGGGEELSGGATFDEHEILDPETGEWEVAVPLTSPRHGLASAAVDGTWYVIGGATRAGAETIVSLTDTVDALPAGEPR